MAEEVMHLMGHLSFSEEEAAVFEPSRVISHEDLEVMDRWLVAKILTSKRVNEKAIMRVFGSVWGPTKLTEATSLCPKMFIFKFATLEDKKMIFNLPLLRKEIPRDNERIWKTLTKLPVMPKIKIFGWRRDENSLYPLWYSLAGGNPAPITASKPTVDHRLWWSEKYNITPKCRSDRPNDDSGSGSVAASSVRLLFSLCFDFWVVFVAVGSLFFLLVLRLFLVTHRWGRHVCDWSGSSGNFRRGVAAVDVGRLELTGNGGWELGFENPS
ncbi:hypothetical protein F3Y22_tig00002237pilonHSYRG00581 [Hibiscus syriacus]|uniref:DUF4283 domain-containing protein n=1 Tax=Hibiscus syriacus TaxID=106335 RepID=A0A6A3CSG2_HIBSY|nr:hypothetical protein F3Y22_tig00002237pilonHSYRG00581 [Hibiscus syriacus]